MSNMSSESHLAGLGVFVRNGDLDCRESVQNIKLGIESVHAPNVESKTAVCYFCEVQRRVVVDILIYVRYPQ